VEAFYFCELEIGGNSDEKSVKRGKGDRGEGGGVLEIGKVFIRSPVKCCPLPFLRGIRWRSKREGGHIQGKRRRPRGRKI